MELLLTLLIVTFLSFLLVKLSPVDAAEAYARRTFMLYTPEQLDALREKMGLNQPLLVQYGTSEKYVLDFGGYISSTKFHRVVVKSGCRRQATGSPERFA